MNSLVETSFTKMSDPSKSATTFNFGVPATSGGTSSSGLFGQASTNNTSSSNMFGPASSKTSSSTGNMFGSLANTTDTVDPSNFATTTTTSASSQPSQLGSAPTTSQIPLGIQNSSASNPFGGGVNAATGGGFPVFSTPNKSTDASDPSQSKPSNLFGGLASGTVPLFGNQGSNATSSGQTGSTTPAPNKPAGVLAFGNVSTTPAGPPPSGATGTVVGLGSGFSFENPQNQKPSLFGNVGAGSNSASQTPAIAAQSNPFGGSSSASGSGIFGSSKAFDKPGTTTAPSSMGLFSTTPNTSVSNLFANNKPSILQGGPFFSTTPIQKANANQQAQGSGSQALSLFPAPTSPKPATGDSTEASGLYMMSGGLGPNQPPKISPLSNSSQNSGQTNTNPNANSSGNNNANPFANFSAQSTNTAAPTIPTATSAQSPFSFPSLNKSKNTPTTSTATATIPTSTFTSNPQAPTSQIFGHETSKSNTDKLVQPATESNKSSSADNAAASTANLGASTSGPRPPAQSRLKNKSMDEIITRWASDLSKYQKEFQKQAQKVAGWDRLLVENSDKIQKLYGSTLEAERATVEVERQLSAVENDQAELEYWLEHYEKQVDEMMATQVGQGDTLQGPDQERERT